MTRTLILASAFAATFATSAMAQRYYYHDRDFDHERGLSVPGAILKTFTEREGDCTVIITRRRTPDGDVVTTRRRECD